MNRKVLFVHDGPLYTTENGEVFTIQLTEKVKQRYLQLGDSITYCLRERKITEEDSKRYSRILPENFSFKPFPNFKNLRDYFSNKSKAKHIINNLVISHDLLVIRMPSASGAIALKAARKHNIPYLVEMVSCAYDALWHYDWRGKLMAYYKLKKFQNLIKDCPYVVYVTKEFLQKRYPTKGTSINCSNVELKDILESTLRNRIIKIQKQEEPLLLGSIGVVDVKYKGQADVIRALYNLKKQNKLFHYKIVGQGDPTRLQTLINQLNMQEEIEIVGSLPSTQINSFLESIDLYIQPSKTEGLPRALIEALSMACPALGSEVGGIPELLEKDCLFQAGNIKEIMEVLQTFNEEKIFKEAQGNFKKSADYQSVILEQRRREFYNKFLRENNFE